MKSFVGGVFCIVFVGFVAITAGALLLKWAEVLDRWLH